MGNIRSQHYLGARHYHASASNSQYIPILVNGDQITIEISDVTNNSRNAETDVRVVLKGIPDGLLFLSADVPLGTWDEFTLTWNIPLLPPYSSATGALTFEITDELLHPYVFEFEVIGTSCEKWLDDNYLVVTVDGLSCGEISDCVTDRLNLEEEINCSIIQY